LRLPWSLVDLLAGLDVRIVAEVDLRPAQPERLADPDPGMAEELEEQPVAARDVRETEIILPGKELYGERPKKSGD
jgi:hypothetical protein